MGWDILDVFIPYQLFEDAIFEGSYDGMSQTALLGELSKHPEHVKYIDDRKYFHIAIDLRPVCPRIINWTPGTKSFHILENIDDDGIYALRDSSGMHPSVIAYRKFLPGILDFNRPERHGLADLKPPFIELMVNDLVVGNWMDMTFNIFDDGFEINQTFNPLVNLSNVIDAYGIGNGTVLHSRLCGRCTVEVMDITRNIKVTALEGTRPGFVLDEFGRSCGEGECMLFPDDKTLTWDNPSPGGLERFNIAECLIRAAALPGMHLYTPMAGDVTLKWVKPSGIMCVAGDSREFIFDYSGRLYEGGECLLFLDRNCRPWTDAILPDVAESAAETYEQYVESNTKNDKDYVRPTLKDAYRTGARFMYLTLMNDKAVIEKMMDCES